MALIPINNCVLVELLDDYEFATTPDKEYSTKTSGIARIISTFERVDKNNFDKLTKIREVIFNKRIWFSSYKDDSKIEQDGKTYTFIKYEDILGYEDENN